MLPFLTKVLTEWRLNLAIMPLLQASCQLWTCEDGRYVCRLRCPGSCDVSGDACSAVGRYRTDRTCAACKKWRCEADKKWMCC